MRTVAVEDLLELVLEIAYDLRAREGFVTVSGASPDGSVRSDIWLVVMFCLAADVLV
jgi:hypothetical protein